MLNDCISVHNRKEPKYAEIFKLAAELAERDIPFEIEYITDCGLKQCYLRNFGGQQLMTVAQGIGTKGFEDGLLEIVWLAYPEEEENEDDTIGWLTAGNVLERILKKEAEKYGEKE